MEPHERVSKRSRGKMIIDNFLGGIAWSLGVWIGATLIIAIIIFALSKVNYIPIVGGIVVEILNYIGENSFQIGS